MSEVQFSLKRKLSIFDKIYVDFYFTTYFPSLYESRDNYVELSELEFDAQMMVPITKNIGFLIDKNGKPFIINFNEKIGIRTYLFNDDNNDRVLQFYGNARLGGESLILTQKQKLYKMSKDYFLPKNLNSCNLKDSISLICFSLSIKKIYAGANHFIIWTSCNNLFSLGDNTYGQLGLDNKEQYIDIPTQILLPDRVKNCFVGDDSNFIILENNILLGFGWNHNYLFGWNRIKFEKGVKPHDETRIRKPIPIYFPHVANIKHITATSNASFILLDNGKIWSCGLSYDLGQKTNKYGELTAIKHKISHIEANTKAVYASVEGENSIYFWFSYYMKTWPGDTFKENRMPTYIKLDCKKFENKNIVLNINNVDQILSVYALDNDFWFKYWIMRHYFCKDLVNVIILK